MTSRRFDSAAGGTGSRILGRRISYCFTNASVATRRIDSAAAGTGSRFLGRRMFLLTLLAAASVALASAAVSEDAAGGGGNPRHHHRRRRQRQLVDPDRPLGTVPESAPLYRSDVASAAAASDADASAAHADNLLNRSDDVKHADVPKKRSEDISFNKGREIGKDAKKDGRAGGGGSLLRGGGGGRRTLRDIDDAAAEGGEDGLITTNADEGANRKATAEAKVTTRLANDSAWGWLSKTDSGL